MLPPQPRSHRSKGTTTLKNGGVFQKVSRVAAGCCGKWSEAGFAPARRQSLPDLKRLILRKPAEFKQPGYPIYGSNPRPQR